MSSFSLVSALLTVLYFVSPVRANQICGGVGTHNYTTAIYYMGNFFYKAPDIFGLCADWCKSDSSRCKAFRYSYWNDESDAQYCEFFNKTVESFFIPDSQQPYWYYDVGCPNLPHFALTEQATGAAVAATGPVGVTKTISRTLTQTRTQTQTQTMVTTVLVTLYSKTRTMIKYITSTRVSTATVRVASKTATVTKTVRG